MAQADAKEEKDDWATAKLEIPNIAIVPRWGANWEKEENVHWYPGVLKELSSNKNVNIVKVCAFTFCLFFCLTNKRSKIINHDHYISIAIRFACLILFFFCFFTDRFGTRYKQANN